MKKTLYITGKTWIFGIIRNAAEQADLVTPSASATGNITKNGGSARGVSVCSVAGRAAIPAHHVSFGTVIFFVRSFDCRNKT